MIDPFEDREVAEARGRDALLDTLDNLDVSLLSDDQLERLYQCAEALKVECECEFVRRDTGEDE